MPTPLRHQPDEPLPSQPAAPLQLQSDKPLPSQPAAPIQLQIAAPEPAANLPSRQKSNLPTCQFPKNQVILSAIILSGII